MKKVRIGIFGVGPRGEDLARNFMMLNCDIVAICDNRKAVLDRVGEKLGKDVLKFESFDDFIKTDMDAVILTNFVHEHAPYAIKCFERGLHVFSEVLPVQNMKEAVELIEAVEKSGKIYAYGENYCYMPGPYEMRRLYKEGKIGEFEYGEGEYIHNCEPIWHDITYGEEDHWRNNMYATFYCTHSMGPLVHITGLRPVRVTGFESPMIKRNLRIGSKSGLFGIEMVEFENGAIAKSIHGGLYKNSIWYTVYGSLGRLETSREDADISGVARLYLNRDYEDGKYGNEEHLDYFPKRDMDEKAEFFGHGNSDFYSMYNFIRKIQGYEDADTIDVYEALDMFLPGLFAYRSVLAGGIPLDIPNLRLPEEREKWRNDTTCSDKKAAGDMYVPSFSKGNPDIGPEVYERMYKMWKREI